jgi:hypothetical protein
VFVEILIPGRAGRSFYMVCRIPEELAEISCQVRGELVGMSVNVAINGFQRNPY